MERLRRGNEDAYRDLFDALYPSMCSIARHYLGDKSQAESIAADAFFCLWKVRATLKDDTDLGAYLRQSIKNKCLNYLKSKYRRSEVPFTLLYDNLESFDTSFEESQGPATGILSKELEERIARAVNNLPEKTREVFVRNKFRGMSYDEIARQLGISVNTVKYHMKNALSTLRLELGT